MPDPAIDPEMASNIREMLSPAELEVLFGGTLMAAGFSISVDISGRNNPYEPEEVEYPVPPL